MVRSWYEQGLINSESAVQRAGSKSWTKLAQAVDLRAWGNLAAAPKKAVRKPPRRRPARGPRPTTRDTAPSDRPPLAEHWGTSLAGLAPPRRRGRRGLLLLAPAGRGLAPRPGALLAGGPGPARLRSRPAPRLGMSRKIVRVAALAARDPGLPPPRASSSHKGCAGRRSWRSLGAVVLFFALFAFLAEPAPHWAKAALGLVAVLGGGLPRRLLRLRGRDRRPEADPRGHHPGAPLQRPLPRRSSSIFPRAGASSRRTRRRGHSRRCPGDLRRSPASRPSAT